MNFEFTPEVIGVLIFVGIMAAIGLIPGGIAGLRGHQNAGAVTVCGMMSLVPLGVGIYLNLQTWMVVMMGLPFWMGAMVWSCTSQPRPPVYRPRVRRQRQYDPQADDAAEALERMK